ncbi:MAG TPA: ABC transporter substrate-binding protein [Alphaproteobacteria bacterium]|nr:ABC transporter substrate-binding protein [Alphaproteobacteria bacterium]
MSDPKDFMDDGPFPLNRRRLLLGASAGAAALALAASPFRRAFAKESLTVADPGGVWTPACDAAFVKPFAKEANIDINHIARTHYPTTEIKANVETKAYTWDVVIATASDVYELSPQHLLEPLDWSGEDMSEIMPTARKPDWMGTDVYATIIAYRTDKYGKNGPKSWADFWNVEKFPGRRAMHKHPIDTLEEALMADGVPMDKLYPLDVDRAFKKLDQIKPHVNVWWTGGAQTTQMLESGEVDMIPTWNARAQVVIEAGKPVEIEWNQGIYSMEGWVIPKGDPKAALGKKFIKFCANAKRQAAFATQLFYGPTNPKAYDFIPKDRVKYFPTAPENVKRMVLSSTEWWGTNKDKTLERFNAWLLS